MKLLVMQFSEAEDSRSETSNSAFILMLLQMKLKVVKIVIRARLCPKNIIVWNVIARYVFKEGSEKRTISVFKVKRKRSE
jgi:hypothetical protein